MIDAMPAVAGRRGYRLATLAGTAVLVALGCLTSLLPRLGGLRDAIGVALALILFIGWHVLSWPRARAARLQALIVAPAVTVLGGWLLMTGAVEAQAYYNGAPGWVTILEWVSLIGWPALLVWPTAWVALAVVERRA